MATLTNEITKDIISKFGKDDKDTGNPKVQVALLSHRIRELTKHIKSNKKDVHSRKGLTDMVSQRRRLLRYMENTNLDGYRNLIKELGLRR